MHYMQREARLMREILISNSAYVTIFKAQIDLPEIRIQKVQNPIVFIAVALLMESNPTKGIFLIRFAECLTLAIYVVEVHHGRQATPIKYGGGGSTGTTSKCEALQAYYLKVSSNSETESSHLLSTFCRCRAAVWYIHAVSTSTYEQTSQLGKSDWLQYICEAGTSKECCGGNHPGPCNSWTAGRSFSGE